MDAAGKPAQEAAMQSQSFAAILKKTIEEFKEEKKKLDEIKMEVIGQGKNKVVHNEQVMAVKPKAGVILDKSKIAAATKHIEGALHSIQVKGVRETKAGTQMVNFPWIPPLLRGLSSL